MSTKMINDRMCVRCTTLSPTPFLKTWFHKLAEKGLIRYVDKIVDLGCGNGRNMKYLVDKGYEVTGVDMVGEGSIVKAILGHDKLPFEDKSVDVVLLNYVLMFLGKEERAQLIGEINRIAADECVFFVEMYAAKDGHAKTDEACEHFLSEMQDLLGENWWVYRKSKLRRIFWLNGKS